MLNAEPSVYQMNDVSDVSHEHTHTYNLWVGSFTINIYGGEMV